MEQIKIDPIYIRKLVETAKQSTCKRSKCGSLIISEDKHIIGYGFNSKPCKEII